jgi:hypothetical protein
MPVRGVITLYFQVSDLITRVRFHVIPGLGTPCILGCNFINLHVRSIHPKEGMADLNEGGSVDIASGIDAENAASAPNSRTDCIHEGSTEPQDGNSPSF